MRRKSEPHPPPGRGAGRGAWGVGRGAWGAGCGVRGAGRDPSMCLRRCYRARWRLDVRVAEPRALAARGMCPADGAGRARRPALRLPAVVRGPHRQDHEPEGG
ncbi:MAG TPA: hypothetical protein ENK18_07720 [Deltaproteobacteria bacterium]|nr:hypothetical protein [Deltaproteobacteria bacterium]